MALFSKKTADTQLAATKKEPKIFGSGSAKRSTMKSSAISSPRVSEKAATLAAKNVYVFNVPTSANKVEIRKSVEAMYSVKVIGVRTVRGAGKFVRRGKTSGQRNAWKKAMVTLAKGSTLNLYSGV